MDIRKYRKPLILFMIYIVFFGLFSLIMVVLLPEAPPLSPFIPGDNEGLEIFILTVILWPLISVIAAVLGGYLLSPLFLIIYRKILGSKMIYGIQDRPDPEKFTKSYRGFFPALMSLNLVISYLTTPAILRVVVHPGMEPAMELIFGSSVLLVVGIAVSMALFSAVWFLMDAGIVYSNETALKDADSPVEVSSVGKWYLNILQGYAGLSILASYYQILQIYMTSMHEEIISFGAILDLSVLLPLVIFVAMSAIPAVIILDIVRMHRIAFIRNWAKRFGIVEFVEVTLEKKKE